MARPAAHEAAGFLFTGVEVSVILLRKDDLTWKGPSLRLLRCARNNTVTGIHPFSLPWREGGRRRGKRHPHPGRLPIEGRGDYGHSSLDSPFLGRVWE